MLEQALSSPRAVILTSTTVGNALKYTRSGTVTIKLFTSQGSPASSSANGMTQVTLQVEDTGIGMTRDFVSNDLFVPFRQADSHSSGTGLGLSIVKEVAKEFKGCLDVNSDLGKGSCVSVGFIAKFAEPLNGANDDFGALPGISVKHLRMLDVAGHLGQARSDSTERIADSIQRMASQWLGCEVSSSRTGTPGPRGIICAISENEITTLYAKSESGVQTLVSKLAESDSRLLIFGQSVMSCQPAFQFENFAFKPLYVHQP